MARVSNLQRASKRKWRKDLARRQMIMELAPLFSATTLALASGLDRATIYRHCPDVGTKRITPPQTAELLLEGLGRARRLLIKPSDWPEHLMPSTVVEDLRSRMDLDVLGNYLQVVAGELRMRPMNMRVFALELAVACNSVEHWFDQHEKEGGL